MDGIFIKDKDALINKFKLIFNFKISLPIQNLFYWILFIYFIYLNIKEVNLRISSRNDGIDDRSSKGIIIIKIRIKFTVAQIKGPKHVPPFQSAPNRIL